MSVSERGFLRYSSKSCWSVVSSTEVASCSGPERSTPAENHVILVFFDIHLTLSALRFPRQPRRASRSEVRGRKSSNSLVVSILLSDSPQTAFGDWEKFNIATRLSPTSQLSLSDPRAEPSFVADTQETDAVERVGLKTGRSPVLPASNLLVWTRASSISLDVLERRCLRWIICTITAVLYDV